MKKIFHIQFCVLLLFIEVSAQIYVSPTGSDSSSGSIDKPFRTISKAITQIPTGGTVYIRSGNYSGFNTSAHGSETDYINIWAYPGERPVISGGYDCIEITGNYIYLKGIEQTSAAHCGIVITGSYNIIENCSFHNNGNSGLNMGNASTVGIPSYNLIKNCDSYYNFDAPDGGNADGYACKYNVGIGNEFTGCRAYNNSDDGWDLWMANSGVEIDSCWAFRNGVDIWHTGQFAGNGNGFKLGGNKIAAVHILKNCIAFDDTGNSGGKGFDQNNNTAGQMLFNCTAFRNKSANFSFPGALTTGMHVIKNCISLEGSVSIANADQSANSWLGMTAKESDFSSLDTSLALAPRQADGTLPETALFHLQANSQFIDAGVDLGLPFLGKAPDMGAFEFQSVAGIEKSGLPVAYYLGQNYPNPFNPATTISYWISNEEFVSLEVYNTLGTQVANPVHELKQTGNYTVVFNAQGLASGVYYYRIIAGNFSALKKMIVLK